MFPQISAKIQANIDKLVQKTFRDLHGAVSKVLELIFSDVEMALASNSQVLNSARGHINPEEEKRKEGLVAVIKELNASHGELLATISNL